MAVKIHFTVTDPYGSHRENTDLVMMLSKRLADTCSRYKPVSDPGIADLILILEDNQFKDYRYVSKVRSSLPWLRSNIDRVFAYNYQDGPVPFFPGVYASLPAKAFDQSTHQAGVYIHQYNDTVREMASERTRFSPTRLASFRGSLSSKVRNRLLASRDKLQPHGIHIKVSTGWYNHSSEDKRQYVESILKSKFVICPRGIGTSSERMYEVMQLGRVPVVLADEWVQPTGPPWNDFIIRINEEEVDSLPRVLETNENRWPEMAQVAREVWEEWIAPDRVVLKTVSWAHELQATMSNVDPQERWNQFTRWESIITKIRNGWTMPQKVWASICNGRFIEKIQSRLD